MSEKLGNFLDDVSIDEWNEVSLKSWNDLNQKTFFELLKPGGPKVEGSIENGLSENRFRELLNKGGSKMNKDIKQDLKANDFLQSGIDEMLDRAATYDKPDGERSMGKTVEMFNAMSGMELSEEQGWKFMICLKLVRSEQGSYRADSYVDGAAYFGLAGETAGKN